MIGPASCLIYLTIINLGSIAYPAQHAGAIARFYPWIWSLQVVKRCFFDGFSITCETAEVAAVTAFWHPLALLG